MKKRRNIHRKHPRKKRKTSTRNGKPKKEETQNTTPGRRKTRCRAKGETQQGKEGRIRQKDQGRGRK
jgi:hypothetical protein